MVCLEIKEEEEIEVIYINTSKRIIITKVHTIDFILTYLTPLASHVNSFHFSWGKADFM